MSLFDALRGANQFETFFKVAAVCFAFILVCSCSIGCAIRCRLCCKTDKKTHPQQRKRVEKADDILVNEFFRRFPIQRPGTTVDVEAPVTFHLLKLEDPMPTGRFFRKEGRIVFDDRNGVRKKVGQRLTDVMTVQASRILAGPSPDSINPVNGVYYEMEIGALGMMVSKEGSIQPTQVCIGWASTPYPPFEIVGNARFSLGLFSDGRVLASRLGPYDESMILPGGYQEGDVVGAGYEVDKEAGIIEFYFTHNGRRLPPLPNDCGVYDLHKARKYSAPDPLGPSNSKAKRRRRRSSVVGASVLAGGCAYPTVSAIGPAVLEPHFSGPYVYERGAFGRGDSLRRDLVHKMFGNAKPNTRVTRGRRHTATAAAGLEAWAMFAQQAAMEGKEILSGTPTFNHKDEPPKPRWSMGGPSQTAGDEESSDDEAPRVAPTQNKRGRRLSAPAALLGDAMKGWADRAAAVRVTRRTGLGVRVKQLVGSNLQELLGDGEGDDDAALHASSASISRQRRASIGSHVSNGSRASATRRGRRSSLGSAASNTLQRRLSGASATRERRASVDAALRERRSSIDAGARARLQRRLSGASASSAASGTRRARRHSMSSAASNHSSNSRAGSRARRHSVSSAASAASNGKRQRRHSTSSGASPTKRRGSKTSWLMKRQSTLDSDDADALPMEPTPSRGSRQRRHSISSATGAGKARRSSKSSMSRQRRGSDAAVLKARRPSFASNASNASHASFASLARSRGSNASMASLARSRVSMASVNSAMREDKKRRRSIGASGHVSPSVAKAGRRASRQRQRRPSMSGDSVMDVDWKAGGLGVGGDDRNDAAGARGGRKRRSSLGLPSPVAGAGKLKLKPLQG